MNGYSGNVQVYVGISNTRIIIFFLSIMLLFVHANFYLAQVSIKTTFHIMVFNEMLN